MVYSDGTNTNNGLTLLNNSGTVTINNPGQNVVISKNGLNNDQGGKSAGKFFNTTPIYAYSVIGNVDGVKDQKPQYLVAIGLGSQSDSSKANVLSVWDKVEITLTIHISINSIIILPLIWPLMPFQLFLSRGFQH
ncbi:hypothetical protein ACYATO_07060 [Lactobacillaceae bacterium Melli_B3]